MSNKTIFRVVILLAVSLLLMIVGRYSPLSTYFTIEYLEGAIQEAGAFGVLFFVLVYTIGTLMNIPGFLFLFVGFLVYKGIDGVLVGYLASVVAVTVHFFFVRLMAGEALSEIKQPFVRKQMKRLSKSPINTTVVLRLIFYVSPPVNYALALSNIKWHHSLIGTMLAFPFNVLFNYTWMMFARIGFWRWFKTV